MDGVALLAIFVLAVFVGFEVVSKVSTTLHTPLMSGANAIHGIILVGAIIVTGQAHRRLDARRSALLAIVLATVNMVGGFVVTDRMLEMFKGRPPARRRRLATGGPPGERALGHRRRAAATWSPPSASSSRSRGCRQPADGPPRQPDRRRRAPRSPWSPRSSPTDLENLALILVRDRGRHARSRVPAARRVQMTQMPQLVALFNGVGGGAAAAGRRDPRAARPVAGLTRDHRRGARQPAAIAFTVLVGSVSFAGSCVTFAKLQELMTTRPVVVPGGRAVLVGGLVGRRARARPA